MSSTLVIAGGYTAGHITPGLALAEALAPGVRCVFMGAPDGIEAGLVAQAGLPFVGVRALPWAGRGARARIGSLAALAPAVWQARRELKKLQAGALVGLGSFAALAPGLAAASLGLPLILHESNTTLGLANRVLRPFARALLVSRLFQLGSSPARGAQPVVTGVPLRRTVIALATHPVVFPSASTTARVLVLGGSLGNPFLNHRMPAVLPLLSALRPGVAVTHQCGHGVDPAPIRQAYAAAGIPAEVQPFLDPIAGAFASAHLVVATAGAITLHELAAAGIPALIVPLEGSAARHQHANAFAFTALTGCPHASEATWADAMVADTLATLLTDSESWRSCSRRLRLLHPPDSAEHTAKVLQIFLT